MAVETMKSYSGGEGNEKALSDAAAAGIQGVEQVIRLLSNGTQLPRNTHPISSNRWAEITAATDATVNHFRKMISLLGRPRTGHARFKRAPVTTPVDTEQRGEVGSSASAFRVYCPTPTPIHRLPPLPHQRKSNHLPAVIKNGFLERNEAISSMTAGETESVEQYHRSLSSAFQFTSPSVVLYSSGKPPLSSSVKRRRCNSMNAARHCTASSGGCHCSKKRKLRVKRVTRVGAISGSKMSDIPPDEYSWRKYGQKAIKGSPHQRGYYKCSSMRGCPCPARKRVERAVDDPMILVVTYEGDHNHSNTAPQSASVVLQDGGAG